MNKPCSYLIMAGGTGGHIFPAMAVARSLIEKGADVHWLGTETGMEHHLVPSESIPLHLIHIKGFRGKKLLAKILTPFLLSYAVFQALRVIFKIKPVAVIGFGGYVSAPGGIAARLLGKTLIIHEQNSVAGSTNKLLSKISSCNLEAFPNSLPNAIRVGNPVRSEIRALFDRASHASVKANAHAKKKLLIMGGSLGAAAINQIMPSVIKHLSPHDRPEIWHQAGKGKHIELINDYQSDGIPAHVEEFIADVAAAYSWADLVICRAGALTVSEIAVAGLPAIFVPYPYAIDNHQFYNAQWLVENKAAYAIEQKELTIENLSKLLTSMLSDGLSLSIMSETLKKLAMPDATDQVVAVCDLANKGGTLSINNVKKILKNSINKNNKGESNHAA